MDAHYAFFYARDVLKGPFPAGEEVLAKNETYSQRYADNVLEADFYFDNKLIAKYKW